MLIADASVQPLLQGPWVPSCRAAILSQGPNKLPTAPCSWASQLVPNTAVTFLLQAQFSFTKFPGWPKGVASCASLWTSPSTHLLPLPLHTLPTCGLAALILLQAQPYPGSHSSQPFRQAPGSFTSCVQCVPSSIPTRMQAPQGRDRRLGLHW